MDYLSKVSPEWKTKVGVDTAVNWPTGVGGQGNEGVAGLVTQTPGAIGYVELIYALQNKISYGSVQNMAGEFVRASVPSVTAAAAAAAAKMPPDFRVSITNAPGKGVYPISSFTWLLLYENPKDKAQAKAMVDFVKWALTDGQKYCADSATRRCRRAGREAGDGGAGEDQNFLGQVYGAGRPAGRQGSRRGLRQEDLGFRMGTGAFALVLVLIVCAHRLRADPAVDAVDREIRLQLLAHILGIRSPASSARCRSSGARSTRRFWRC